MTPFEFLETLKNRNSGVFHGADDEDFVILRCVVSTCDTECDRHTDTNLLPTFKRRLPTTATRDVNQAKMAFYWYDSTD